MLTRGDGFSESEPCIDASECARYDVTVAANEICPSARDTGIQQPLLNKM